MVWPKVPLSTLCDILDNLRKPITLKDRVDGPYPYYGATGILSYVNDFIFDEELVLVGEDGAKWGVGDNSAFKISGKAWVNNHAHVLRPLRDKVLDEWLIYYLNGTDLSDFITGLTVPKLNQGKLKEIPIPLPPIEEQKRIVAILDQAFADIDQARATAETNLKSARELFDSYLEQVFSQRGEGWVEKTVIEVAALSRGQNPPKSEFVYEPKDGYVRFYQIRDGKSDKDAVYVPESPKLQYVKKEDILMVAYRHVGRAFRGVEGAFNVALCKISNRNAEVLHTDYLFHLIPSSFIKGELLKVSERSLIPSMSISHLASLNIPIPPKEDQDEIVKKINYLKLKCEELESIYRKKIANLDELKKSILQKAFTGELTKSKGIAA
ncbi:hypothetical protein AAY72_04975 [Alishewanella sp. WH16-1]|uniref:restriction endonuclease subunit S n=1 Tax=Alishewanella sp. WH16-1 TaxID=1651088 RepID=UPI000709A630|nr:restriction endonuclease subunit S [Alishewanella sp. WH16-1]KRS22154.1 hypothetical protein AAY72_04975 [Alishewanella sp. WH16-1]